MVRSWIILSALVCVVAAAASEEVSVAAIKKMKVSALKQFLEDRGVECRGCTEKGEFVKKAIDSRKIPSMNAAPPPVEISEDPLWEQWAKIAKETCAGVVSEDQKASGYCDTLYDAVETVVERYTKRYQKELRVERLTFIKYTMSHPYKAAGEARIRKVAKWMADSNTKSLSKIEERLEKPLQSWMRDCALQNINTMLDTLKGRDEL